MFLEYRSPVSDFLLNDTFVSVVANAVILFISVPVRCCCRTTAAFVSDAAVVKTVSHLLAVFETIIAFVGANTAVVRCYCNCLR